MRHYFLVIQGTYLSTLALEKYRYKLVPKIFIYFPAYNKCSNFLDKNTLLNLCGYVFWQNVIFIHTGLVMLDPFIDN